MMQAIWLHQGSLGRSMIHAGRHFASDSHLKRTPLYDFHVQQGGTHPSNYI
jgi:hypothetical protein